VSRARDHLMAADLPEQEYASYAWMKCRNGNARRSAIPVLELAWCIRRRDPRALGIPAKRTNKIALIACGGNLR
jgi:hypothetical protein